MNFHLKINKFFKIFVFLFRIFSHKFRKTFAFNIFPCDSPAAVYFSYIKKLWNFKSCFLNSCIIKCFVKNLCFCKSFFIKNFYKLITVAINFFVLSLNNSCHKRHPLFIIHKRKFTVKLIICRNKHEDTYL